MTAKLLFLAKQGRRDIQVVIAFLTTRFKSPEKDDYKKLARVIRYLRMTKGLMFKLEADETHIVKWWVDAPFAVHKDIRSRTGGAMTTGNVSVFSTLTQQKLYTKSSTKAELIGVDDVMLMII